MLTLINEWRIGWFLIYWSFFQPKTAQFHIRHDLITRLGFESNKKGKRTYEFRFLLRYIWHVLFSLVPVLACYLFVLYSIYAVLDIHVLEWRQLMSAMMTAIIIFIVTTLVAFWDYLTAKAIQFGISFSLSYLFLVSLTAIIGYSLLTGLIAGLLLGVNLSSLMATLNLDDEIDIISAFITLIIAFSVVGVLIAFDEKSILPAFLVQSINVGILRLCFWVPEFLLCIFLTFRNHVFQKAVPISLIPTNFDEVIILPLPFLAHLIAKSHEGQPNQVLSHIKYLENYTGKRKLASDSLTLIILTLLEKGKTMATIAEVAKKTQWVSDFNHSNCVDIQVMISLVEVSQEIYHIREMYSLYYAEEISRKILDRFPSIKKELRKSNSPYQFRLRKIIKTWLQLITVANRNYAQQFANSFEVPPVYISSDVLNPVHTADCFKGRTEIFATMNNLVLEQQCSVIWLQGSSRVGKSSLLNFLPARLAPNILPILIDFRRVAIAAESSNLIEEFARSMILFLQQRFEWEAPFLSRRKLANNPLEALDNWFTAMEELKSQTHFLLCLDTYDFIDGLTPEITTEIQILPELLHSLLTKHQRWSLLLSGQQLYGTLNPIWQQLVDGAHKISLDYLSSTEAENLIRHPIQNFPNIYTETAIDAILYWTNCQPYLVQLTGAILVNEMNHGIPEPSNYQVTSSEIDRLMPIILEEAEPFFQQLWSITLSERQRKHLKQLMLDAHLANVDPSAIQALIDKKILSAAEGQYRFQIPLFEEYCRIIIKPQDK